MKIKLLIFLTSSKEDKGEHRSELVMKTFESSFRPFPGDIIEDPGFDARYHNGYEVVKVTVNYEKDECYVSMKPVAIDLEELSIENYIDKLLANGWSIVSKEESVL